MKNMQKVKNEREAALRWMDEKKSIVQKHPLFDQLEKRDKKLEKTEIEKRKQHLKSLRDLH